jgi:hypothetical protein
MYREKVSLGEADLRSIRAQPCKRLHQKADYSCQGSTSSELFGRTIRGA